MTSPLRKTAIAHQLQLPGADDTVFIRCDDGYVQTTRAAAMSSNAELTAIGMVQGCPVYEAVDPEKESGRSLQKSASQSRTFNGVSAFQGLWAISAAKNEYSTSNSKKR